VPIELILSGIAEHLVSLFIIWANRLAFLSTFYFLPKYAE